MRAWRWYSKVLLALLAVAFGYLVWPTPWRYYTLDNGTLLYMVCSKDKQVPPEPLSPVSLLIRQHRVTGQTQMFVGPLGQREWVEMRGR
jgi:hypothetical protein